MTTFAHVPRYNVTLTNPAQNLHVTIPVSAQEYIYDAAEQQGIELPASCRAGACVSCVGRLKDGSVDQDHTFLTPRELDQGYVLTCKAYPLSDCVIETHQEDEFLGI